MVIGQGLEAQVLAMQNAASSQVPIGHAPAPYNNSSAASSLGMPYNNSSAASSLGIGIAAAGSFPSDDERDISGRTISFEDTLARSGNLDFTVGSPDSSGVLERTDRGQFSPNQIRFDPNPNPKDWLQRPNFKK